VYVAGWLSQSRTWKREDRNRDYEFRRDAYAKFLVVADRINAGETGEEVFYELKRAYTDVLLVTRSKEVKETAEILMHAMGLVATGKTAGIAQDFDPMGDFLLATRKEFGLPPIVSPTIEG
jgi:hypothetical protein